MNGLEAALARIKSFTEPRRRRLLVVEDNLAEQLSVTELLAHDDIDIETVGSGGEALERLQAEPADCVVLDLRLPDMSGFDVLEQLQDQGMLADTPVVVFTGRELTTDEDARLHTMARSVVVKGVESPERLLDETALFLHRVVTNLPPEKQRMLERLHSSDEDLMDRTVLLVDDDARNIFALSSILERHGMRVLTATTGSEAVSIVESDPDVAIVLMDIMMPGTGRLRNDAGDQGQPRVPAAADHCPDRQGDEGRPREVPGGRRLRLSGEAGEYQSAALRFAVLAASLNGACAHARAGQHSGGRRPAREIVELPGDPGGTGRSVDRLLGREALAILLKNDVAIVLIDVQMPDLDGFELAAMIREHPRFQRTALIFVSAIHLSDLDRLRGYEAGAVDYVPVPVVPDVLRAKVRVFAELHRKTRQLERLNAELEHQRVAERTAALEDRRERYGT